MSAKYSRHIFVTHCAGFSISMATVEVLPSVSKVAGVWRGVFWCLESVMLWRGIMDLTKFDDKHVNDLDLLLGDVVGVACLHRENPCTAEVLPSVSKVAGVWRSLSWCLESVMLWCGIMGFIEIW